MSFKNTYLYRLTTNSMNILRAITDDSYIERCIQLKKLESENTDFILKIKGSEDTDISPNILQNLELSNNELALSNPFDITSVFDLPINFYTRSQSHNNIITHYRSIDKKVTNLSKTAKKLLVNQNDLKNMFVIEIESIKNLMENYLNVGNIKKIKTDKNNDIETTNIFTNKRYIFSKVGRSWEITFGEHPPLPLPDDVGISYIAYLISNPNKWINANELREKYGKKIITKPGAIDSVGMAINRSIKNIEIIEKEKNIENNLLSTHLLQSIKPFDYYNGRLMYKPSTEFNIEWIINGLKERTK